ncbi:hypothetical protein OG394_06090 [Kribbella sp. NBC_01245]|uniref:hypothetical protein n=1 Tax=Kribbella sp. NBC_01245 TaxID=2903578 RepID=UPI002E27CD36|nr:hypothetical protein [Kribbella sp. NBC_01245]
MKAAVGDAVRLNALLAEVDRLQLQVAELQRANAALREALSTAEMRLVSPRSGYRGWDLVDGSQRQQRTQ